MDSINNSNIVNRFYETLMNLNLQETAEVFKREFESIF